jgi:hypothetical protein
MVIIPDLTEVAELHFCQVWDDDIFMQAQL